MKKLNKIILSLEILSGFFIVSLITSLSSETPILIESLESKTETKGSVYNRIQYKFGWDKDIWMMQQTHKGLDDKYKVWDNLAIVVDKTKKSYVAKFYQVKPGEFDLNKLNAIPYQARCYACHANGPRAIRPNYQGLKISLPDKIKLNFWNLRIKTYGQVESVAGTNFSDGAIFRTHIPMLSKNIDLKSCTTCHSENGIRKPLKLEHIGTVKFMVQNKLMPPFPFKISNEDQEVLKIYFN